MTEIIAYVAFAYLLVQFGVVCANLVTRPVLKKSRTGTGRKISVLIPARNEEKNIGFLLDDLMQAGAGVAEVLVYDDDSTDGTAGIILQKQKIHDRIRYIRGSGPSPGWLGKNHACHELALQAKGEYLLFLDADVRILPSLITDAVHYSERHQLSLLSIFPVQIMKSFGEWLTVPLMNRILLGNLALPLIRLSRIPDFSAANGQFMLFRSDAYKARQYHEKVRGERVEDIRIIRLMKQEGLKVMTLLSGGQIICRMYRGYRDSISGFSKNIHAFFGRIWPVLILYVILNLAGFPAVYAGFGWRAFVLYMAAQLCIIIGVSVLSRQNSLMNILLFPLQWISLAAITVIAVYRQLTGRFYWKGRKLS